MLEYQSRHEGETVSLQVGASCYSCSSACGPVTLLAQGSCGGSQLQTSAVILPDEDFLHMLAKERSNLQGFFPDTYVDD